MFASQNRGDKYVDRDDPSAVDYDVNDFINDNDWHVLDLSGIIGTGKKLVQLYIVFISQNTYAEFHVRTNGNSNEFNVDSLYSQLPDSAVASTLSVFTDVDGKIEYKTTAYGYTYLGVVIRGWFA